MGDIGAGRLSSATRNAPPVDDASAEQILASFTGAPTRAHRARNKYTTPSAHEINQMEQAFQSKQKQAQQEMRSQQPKSQVKHAVRKPRIEDQSISIE